jgi:hypothetical protein
MKSVLSEEDLNPTFFYIFFYFLYFIVIVKNRVLRKRMWRRIIEDDDQHLFSLFNGHKGRERKPLRKYFLLLLLLLATSPIADRYCDYIHVELMRFQLIYWIEYDSWANTTLYIILCMPVLQTFFICVCFLYTYTL